MTKIEQTKKGKGTDGEGVLQSSHLELHVFLIFLNYFSSISNVASLYKKKKKR
jgi:hypothetical protein